jgi:hypothetical protein
VTNPATGLAYTQPQIDAIKFNKFDVNGDGVVNRDDAKYVDRNVGKNYTSLTDVLGTNDDLVAAELNDNNGITHIITGPGSDGTGTSDFKLLRGNLGALLLDGDADISGTVDTVDFNILVSNFSQNVTRWSQGDFDFNGSVDTVDFNLQVANFGSSAPGASIGGLVPEPSTIGLMSFGVASLLRRRRTLLAD